MKPIRPLLEYMDALSPLAKITKTGRFEAGVIAMLEHLKNQTNANTESIKKLTEKK